MTLRTLVAGSRGLAVAAVAALALGIGITALMFAIVDGTVRRGLPVPEPDRVVHLERLPPPGSDTRALFTIGELAALRDQTSLSAIAGYGVRAVNIAAEGVTPRRWDAAFVTRNTFDVLGVAAAQGAVFRDGPVEGALPLLLSDDVWREQFGSAPSAVGRAVRANGEPAVIVGVMPPGFRFPFNQRVWAPVDDRNQATAVSLWGRLAAGRGRRDAEAELSARYQRAADAAAGGARAEGEGARVRVAPYTSYILQPPLVQMLDTMFFAGLGVLIIACANVANLLLARGLARRRDFAIAGALGATRARLVRERLAEGLALAIPGAALGVAFAYAGASAFTRAIAASSPPYWALVVIDIRVLAFVAAAAIAAALAAAAVPAWRSRTAVLSTALADEARGSTSASLRRMTAVAVVIEIALAAAVLVGGGLMAMGIARLTAARYDFAVEEVVTGRISLPARSYAAPDSRRAFFEALHGRLQQLPGAPATALGSSVPFAAVQQVPFTLRPGDSDTTRWPRARQVFVSPGYFATLGVPLIAGRDFERADAPARARVAIVNQSFALKFARREDLIGRSVTAAGTQPVTATIVGVAPDLFVGNPRGEQPEAIYFPLFQLAVPPESISVLARAGSRVRGNQPDPPGGTAGLERALREAVAGLDADLPLDRVMTLAALRHSVTWFYGVFGGLFLVFGIGALLLALVGVYAVMSFAVTERRREIGTRVACGATPARIARLFLREGAMRIVPGLIAGAVLAALLTPRLALFLFQVSPRDPVVFALAIALVAAVGLAACALPALRAARADPNACLRDGT